MRVGVVLAVAGTTVLRAETATMPASPPGKPAAAAQTDTRIAALVADLDAPEITKVMSAYNELMAIAQPLSK